MSSLPLYGVMYTYTVALNNTRSAQLILNNIYIYIYIYVKNINCTSVYIVTGVACIAIGIEWVYCLC